MHVLGGPSQQQGSSNCSSRGVSDRPLVALLWVFTKATFEVIRSGEGSRSSPATVLTLGLGDSCSAGEAVRPKADCDLLWWDEPYNNKITSLPEGTAAILVP